MDHPISAASGQWPPLHFLALRLWPVSARRRRGCDLKSWPPTDSSRLERQLRRLWPAGMRLRRFAACGRAASRTPCSIRVPS